jgi:hypothetical protein
MKTRAEFLETEIFDKVQGAFATPVPGGLLLLTFQKIE